MGILEAEGRHLFERSRRIVRHAFVSPADMPELIEDMSRLALYVSDRGPPSTVIYTTNGPVIVSECAGIRDGSVILGYQAPVYATATDPTDKKE